jgi:hypothetical protein
VGISQEILDLEQKVAALLPSETLIDLRDDPESSGSQYKPNSELSETMQQLENVFRKTD